ncbi:MAG: inositol-phosphate phosphatase [Gammaproteobacteria bacterium]|nr:inositol-phosphate phosphatase [Gammaproteobacteria bacterium]NND58856.1 inositol-phosphate phosphatase [Gammaproteobacteria bacterium]
MQHSERLNKALEAAAAAADIQKHYYGTGVAVDIKDDRSPVTVADRESETTIRNILSAAFPQDGFYGEEHGRSDMDADYVWLIDPLDGTKSFVRGYPFFSIQIALLHGREIVLGVSHAPIFNEIACAERDRGATLNDQELKVSSIDHIPDITLSAGNIHSLAGGPRWNAFGRLISQVSRIRGYGDFYHYHLLAAGKIDAVVESDVNVLDIAALSVIVDEAGGRFTDISGGRISLDTTTVLATNGVLHDQMLAWL